MPCQSPATSNAELWSRRFSSCCGNIGWDSAYLLDIPGRQLRRCSRHIEMLGQRIRNPPSGTKLDQSLGSIRLTHII